MRQKFAWVVLFSFLIPTIAAAQTTAPSEPKISPAARALLDPMRAAYANLKSFEMSGTLALDLDAAGQKEGYKEDFTATYESPIKFRHEMKGDLLLVSDGETLFVYKPDKKKYLSLDAPKSRGTSVDLPSAVSLGLNSQNPSLLLALCNDASVELLRDASTVDRAADVVVDGTSYQSLNLQMPGENQQVLIDPKTHLMRRITIDSREALASRGVPQVKVASVQIDYTKSAVNAPLQSTSFAWTPPADASVFKSADQMEDGEEAAPAAALIGKNAPDFTLKDMQGQDISLASMKGHVVILDFWATWCPPCRAELPLLDQLEKDFASQGLKIVAIDVHEPKDTIQKFLDKNPLSLIVLLDEQGTVTQKQYLNTDGNLPHTVVIGKDGKVKSASIGFGPSSEAKLRGAIQNALKE
jgi:thiol-disulfide isomerase/thioredoxin